jgi:uncharacterized protein YjdB
MKTLKELAVIVMCCLCGMSEIQAEKIRGEVEKGKGMYWYMDESSGVLEIHNTGSEADIAGWGEDELRPWAKYRDKVKYIVITGNIRWIKDRAFEGYHNLKGVSLSQTLLGLEKYAFNDCDALESILLPSISYISERTFANCTKLKKIVSIAFVDGVRGIYITPSTNAQNVFEGIDLTNAQVIVPDHAKDVYRNDPNWGSFGTIKGFSEVFNIYHNYISDGIFYDFDEYTGVLTLSGAGIIPDMGEQGVDQPWFSYRDKIKSIIIEEGITGIGTSRMYFYEINNTNSYTFAYTHATSISLPNTLLSIGRFAFKGCSELKSVTFPQKLDFIGSSAFLECSNLKSVTFSSPSAFTPDPPFPGCILSEVCNLYSEPYVYSDILFSGADLENATLIVPDEAVNRYRYSNKWNNFDWIISLSHYRGGQPYKPQGKPEKEIKNYFSLLGPVGDGVQFYYKYYSHDYVYYDYISYRVLSIFGNGTTMDMGVEAEKQPWNQYESKGYVNNKIVQINVDDGVTGLGRATFGRIAAKTISLPSTLTSIGDGAFEYMDGLESITIPPNVTDIGISVFYGCNLRYLFNLSEEPQLIHKGTLMNVDMDYTVLVVPDSSLGKYKTAERWKRFNNIITLSDYKGQFVSGVSISSKHGEYSRDSQDRVIHSVQPSTALNQQVSFTSTNNKVVSVDGNTGQFKCLSPGTATITVTTAEGGFTDYVDITVKKSSNSYLKNLTSDIEFTPEFDKSVLDYTLPVVPYKTNSISIEASKEDKYATLSIPSKSLTVGNNTLPVIVTADDGSRTTYNLHVYRQSNEDRLEKISVSTGRLDPPFSRNHFDYTLVLPGNADSVDIKGSLVDTKGCFSGDTTLKRPANSVIKLHVIAEDTSYTNTYTITAYWRSGDNALSSLEVEGYELSPAFEPHTQKYTLSLPSFPVSVTIKAEARDSKARVEGVGYVNVWSKGQIIEVIVYSEDGSEKSYYITTNHRNTSGVRTPEHLSNVTYENGSLHISTSFNETVRIYGTAGVLLYKVDKPEGDLILSNDLPSGILIVKGSSGWVQKVIN